MASLLRDPRVHDYHTFAILELERDPSAASMQHPAKNKSHLCYPVGDEKGLMRACFFLNKTMDHI
jgi:hypothetical protein